MGIILDIILVAIVVLNIFLGYKKGLIGVIFNILAFLISIIVTLILLKPVSTYVIENTDLDNNIRNVIVSNNVEITESNESNGSNESESTLIQKYIEDNIRDIGNQAKDQVVETVAESISLKAVEVIVAIGLFIVVRIVVRMFKFLLESLAKIPLIKQFNQVGGVAYGVVKSIVIIYVLLTILFFVVYINNNGMVANMIETSYLTKILYNNNIIVKYCLLGKILV